MEKFIKRIQSRLTYNGIKVSKTECREAFQQFVPQENWNNPSDGQIALVVQQLTLWEKNSQIEESSKNSALKIQEPEISEDLAAPIQEPETFEITPQDNPGIWETLQPPDQQEEPTSLAKTDSASLTVEQPNKIAQPDFNQSLSQAVYQLGIANNSETKQLLSTLFNELSSDISDTEEMVAALVTGYLNKRQSVLSSAIGTIHSVRSAQSESFQSGLSDDFFDRKQKVKQEFLVSVNAIFN